MQAYTLATRHKLYTLRGHGTAGFTHDISGEAGDSLLSFADARRAGTEIKASMCGYRFPGRLKVGRCSGG